MKNKNNSKNGYIYFIMNQNGQIKIGRTSNWISRMRQYKTALPHFIVLSIFPVVDMYIAEKYFHNKYQNYRIEKTEWFNNDIIKDRGIDW